jgi:hypothetical protein
MREAAADQMDEVFDARDARVMKALPANGRASVQAGMGVTVGNARG